MKVTTMNNNKQIKSKQVTNSTVTDHTFLRFLLRSYDSNELLYIRFVPSSQVTAWANNIQPNQRKYCWTFYRQNGKNSTRNICNNTCNGVNTNDNNTMRMFKKKTNSTVSTPRVKQTHCRKQHRPQLPTSTLKSPRQFNDTFCPNELPFFHVDNEKQRLPTSTSTKHCCSKDDDIPDDLLRHRRVTSMRAKYSQVGAKCPWRSRCQSWQDLPGARRPLTASFLLTTPVSPCVNARTHSFAQLTSQTNWKPVSPDRNYPPEPPISRAATKWPQCSRMKKMYRCDEELR